LESTGRTDSIDLLITRLGFESLGPEAGSSLPTDEHGGSEGKQDHAFEITAKHQRRRATDLAV
jgi:hypothetical protein